MKLVLLVDDDRVMLSMIRDMLLDKMIVLRFDNYDSALEFYKFNHHAVDIIISDYRLNKDGLEKNGCDLLKEMMEVAIKPRMIITGSVKISDLKKKCTSKANVYDKDEVSQEFLLNKIMEMTT